MFWHPVNQLIHKDLASQPFGIPTALSVRYERRRRLLSHNFRIRRHGADRVMLDRTGCLAAEGVSAEPDFIDVHSQS